MPASAAQNRRIIDLLTVAYNAECETVLNYICNSVNLDGVRAEQIKEALKADIAAELSHAQQLAARIKTIGGFVPGSLALSWRQKALQPPEDTTDVATVIKGVIAAEEMAIANYENIIKACDGIDWVTQDLAITLMADEQTHWREFIGFLLEYEQERGGRRKESARRAGSHRR
jgi:bacterioferritin